MPYTILYLGLPRIGPQASELQGHVNLHPLEECEAEARFVVRWGPYSAVSIYWGSFLGSLKRFRVGVRQV